MQIDATLLRRCWFLAGPTASGKTSAAIELARRIDAEVIAMDSMTLYRGMDVGTAKPTPAEQAAVRHHLIDILAPFEDCSVADYLRAAEAACRDVIARGRTPLFVGGTGLYLRALLRGVFEGPAADREYRQSLSREAELHGAEMLHRRLESVDPVTANRLHPRDLRRVIRALEILQLTGRRASDLQQEGPLPPELRPRHVYWINPPRNWLHERIDSRVHQMVAAGFVDEVRRLLAGDRPLGRTASRALGYSQIIDHLAGRMTLNAAIESIQTATRRFAKRQHTWFRNLVECRPVPITGSETPAALAESLVQSAAGKDLPESTL